MALVELGVIYLLCLALWSICQCCCWGRRTWPYFRRRNTILFLRRTNERVAGVIWVCTLWFDTYISIIFFYFVNNSWLLL